MAFKLIFIKNFNYNYTTIPNSAHNELKLLKCMHFTALMPRSMHASKETCYQNKVKVIFSRSEQMRWERM